MFQPKISDLAAIGKRIKALREIKGWTQEVLADRLNIARNTLTKLEGGFRDFKSTELLEIARVLDVSTDYLLGREHAAAPDDFMQEAVSRFGLSEMALKTLEQFGATDFHAEESAVRAIMYGDEHVKNAPSPVALYALENLLTDARGQKALEFIAQYLAAGEYRFENGMKTVKVAIGTFKRSSTKPPAAGGGDSITSGRYLAVTPDMMKAIPLNLLNETLAEMRSHPPQEEIDAAKAEFRSKSGGTILIGF
ncbi:MAG: helix-turn-helix domain-containing protein [Oscillospiraceae bacterium]|jgi:transcriptional regulator with XRE-family HTH domain|nr:helix-turn-helix domain-containing protein [Oscillospiraceae bacterium]